MPDTALGASIPEVTHHHVAVNGSDVHLVSAGSDGSPILLVDIPVWDYRWQETYWFREPIVAKAGTRLDIEAVYDNSAKNPNNPQRLS